MGSRAGGGMRSGPVCHTHSSVSSVLHASLYKDCCMPVCMHAARLDARHVWVPSPWPDWLSVPCRYLESYCTVIVIAAGDSGRSAAILGERERDDEEEVGPV